MTETELGIRIARSDEVDAVSDVLAEAFLDGDLAPWLIPSRKERKTVYPGYFRIFAEFFVAHDMVETTDDLAAVAIWWPVGDELVMDIPDYDVRLAKVTGTALGRFVALDMTMHNHHPTRNPHEYLAFLAVRPDRQGKGLGGALLAHHHRQLDTENTPAYVEATGPRNRALYSRLGYRMNQVIAIPGDGPNLYRMWRAPISSESVTVATVSPEKGHSISNLADWSTTNTKIIDAWLAAIHERWTDLSRTRTFANLLAEKTDPNTLVVTLEPAFAHEIQTQVHGLLGPRTHLHMFVEGGFLRQLTPANDENGHLGSYKLCMPTRAELCE